MNKLFDRYLRIILISNSIFFASSMLFLFIWTRFERNVTIPVIIDKVLFKIKAIKYGRLPRHS